MTDEIPDLLALREGLPEGPWSYRPNEHDDWGVVRAKPDATGWSEIIACARGGRYVTLDQFEEHRRNKTDPYEHIARAIAAIPSMLEEIERLRKERSAAENGAIKIADGLANAVAEQDRLRVLNTEMREALKGLLDWWDVGGMESPSIDEVEAKARAILTKTENV